ncbi:hypothetical protein BGV66_29840 [Burkholderia ubonensis]|uniref:Uncharacterized protein n=1 Tax=Burkholderia ubonensis TaxID=101571 RepID=A0ABD6PVA8_9BURK|nr:hypothetical protein BGV66_29840 [Burkholderia ubonensis]
MPVADAEAPSAVLEVPLADALAPAAVDPVPDADAVSPSAVLPVADATEFAPSATLFAPVPGDGNEPASLLLMPVIALLVDVLNELSELLKLSSWSLRPWSVCACALADARLAVPTTLAATARMVNTRNPHDRVSFAT